MNLLPSFEDFEAAWAQGKNQLVYARLAADLDTPVSLMLKLAEARSDTFMLESVTGGEVRGRYSVVGMKPDLIWQCHGQQSRINREARFDPQAFVAESTPPLDSLRALIAESRVDLPEGMPSGSSIRLSAISARSVVRGWPSCGWKAVASNRASRVISDRVPRQRQIRSGFMPTTE